MKKYIHNFIVDTVTTLANDYFTVVLTCPEPLPEVKPGQFAEVLVHNSTTTYLRRPLSIYDVDYEQNAMSFLVKKVGDGTKALAKLNAGDILNVIYPLGNFFSEPKEKKALLVGGGVGIAPMLLLARSLKSKGFQPDTLIGGRTKLDILEPEKYAQFGEVFVTTDDGSAGIKGLVTSHPSLGKNISSYSMIYACGPDPMMKAVAKVAENMNIPCEISLENTMACGIGACLCCVVETIDGNKTTCIEGPVFNSKKLLLRKDE